MSIRNDIKLLENINTTLLLAEKIQVVEKQHGLTSNNSVDLDYQTVLEMVSIYKDILQNRPFVKVASKNTIENTYFDLLDNISGHSSESIAKKLKDLKENIVVDYLDMATSIDRQYKKSGHVITKYGYDNRQPLLPQIKTRINGFLHPTSLLPSEFDKNKIASIRQGFNDNGSSNLSLKFK